MHETEKAFLTELADLLEKYGVETKVVQSAFDGRNLIGYSFPSIPFKEFIVETDRPFNTTSATDIRNIIKENK
ncbi:MAG: hypothetical protein GY820_39170 [Gammaproteobacteria bacterium]|nr:hypothetical protein [Gammaproteobacteria bacterium]